MAHPPIITHDDALTHGLKVKYLKAKYVTLTGKLKFDASVLRSVASRPHHSIEFDIEEYVSDLESANVPVAGWLKGE